IPAIGFGKLIRELGDQQSVPGVSALIFQGHAITAVGTYAAANEVALLSFLSAGIYPVRKLALRTLHVLVLPHQRRGHGTGGDDEGLGLERPKQKREHECDHDRLDRFAYAVMLRRRFPL